MEVRNFKIDCKWGFTLWVVLLRFVKLGEITWKFIITKTWENITLKEYTQKFKNLTLDTIERRIKTEFKELKA